MSNEFTPISIRLSDILKPTASVLFQRLLSRGKFRHVQVLLKLAELGSVQRTADAIGMTQSAVTQALAYLERLLEVPLFQRHARGVRPTEACSALLPVARQLLLGVAEGAQALTAYQAQGQSTVRLVASAAAIHGMLMRVLPQLEAALPGVEVLLREAEGDDQLLAIARAQVDLVACRRPAALPQGWVFQPLVEDRLVVVCTSEHPLAQSKLQQFDPQQLIQHEWLMMPAGTVARERFDSLMAGYQGQLHSHPLVSRVLAPMTWLLQERKLLALLPLSVVRHLVDIGELVVLPIPDASAIEPLGLLLPMDSPTEAATRLAQLLQQVFTAPA